MSRARWVLGATIFAVVCIRGAESLWAGEAPRVSSGPTVTKEGQGFAVAFSVSEPCDVTVRIVDSNGKVVRHLAGGMVGLTAAAEPLRPKSLSQRLTWDGRDDSGKDVAAVGCKALVGVGLKAKFDKFILWEPDGYDRARKDLARVLKGNDDEYLVSQHWGVHMTTTRVFNAQGKFVRQIWPPSLNKPKEKLTRLLSEPMVGGDDWEDRRVPMCVNHNSTYHFGTAWPVLVTRDGSLLGVHGYVSDYLGLWMLDPEGFPVKWAWYPPWQPRQQSVFTKTLWKFAAGPDGDVYLADGIHHVVGHFRVKDMSPVESFKFSGKEELETPRSYIGEVNLNYQAKWQRGPDWKEKPIIDDESHFLGPADVALDKDGQLLVLDGKLDKRGVIEGEAKVKVYARDGRYVKTVDKSAFPASDAAVPEAVAAAGGNDRAVCFPHFLRVDSQGRLYVKNQGMGKGFIVTDVDGKGFRVPRLPWGWASSQGYTCVDAEDNWYVAVGRKNEASRLWKYAPDGKQLKFGDADALLIEKDWEIKGACVAPGGDIYVVVTTDKWKVTREVTKVCAFGDLTGRGQEVCQTRVDVYGPDATLKKKGVVMSVGINDVAVDRDGGIYVIDGTMWHGAQMTSTAKGGVTGRKRAWPFAYLTPEQAKLDPRTQWNKRFSLLSRLVKFSPEGGSLDGVDGKAQLWDYAGVSGVSPWNCASECPGAQICLDADGRAWVPDSFMYQIKAVDGAGNLIARVGAYGNEECRGGGGDRMVPGTNVVADPEVPLARPSGIAVHGDYLLISDMHAHRVMRCRLEYADKKETAVR